MKDSGAVVIKKYGNRRLYDTSASRYVNLDDIAAQVRNGKDVKVVDAKSGEDLTRTTLAQIIMEEAKDQPAGLPVELLRQLLIASDKVRQDLMGWYLKSAMDGYQKVQSAVQTGLSQVFSPFDLVKSFIPKTGGDEAEQLRQKVAELEKELESRKAPRKARKVVKSARSTKTAKTRSKR